MRKIFSRRTSLTLRLVLVAIIWSAAALMAGGASLAKIFGSSVTKSFEDAIAVYIDSLSATVDVDKSGNLIVINPPVDPRFTRPLSGYYWTVADVDKSGNIKTNNVRSRSLFDETLNLTPDLKEKVLRDPGVNFFDDVNRKGENLKIGARLITLPDRKISTILVVAFDRTKLEKSKNRFNLTLAASLAALLVGLIIAIILQVRVGLNPLHEMGKELANIRSGRADKLDEDLPREIAPLARELNALLKHNEEVVERARTHVGNLAHALKTPISVMINEASQHDDAFGALVMRQTQTMQRQVEHYLKRARAAARAETLRARTPVFPVVDDLVRTLGKLYRNDGVSVIINGTTKANFRGEREDLEDLFGNLAENACKYGGGLVEIGFDESSTSFVTILIDDDGDGLSTKQVENALKRGVRLDESMKGSGLGLSISNELAIAYGGSLEFEQSPIGGLRIKLKLPIAQ